MDELAERTIAIQNEIDALKAAQPLGIDNYRIYQSSLDVSQTGWTLGNAETSIEIYFDTEDSAPFPLTELTVDFYIDGSLKTATKVMPEEDEFTYGWSYKDNSVYRWRLIIPRQGRAAVPISRNFWKLVINDEGGDRIPEDLRQITIRLVISVKSNLPGRLSTKFNWGVQVS